MKLPHAGLWFIYFIFTEIELSEVVKALKSININKAEGPDELNPYLNKKNWRRDHLIGE